MTFETISASDVPLAEQAKTFSLAFTGYVGGSFEMDASALARFLCLQGADLCYSVFARTAEGLSGFAYVNRTGNISRVAGMGVLPSCRRAGIARGLLTYLVNEARARGDQAIVLEVIEQNPAAHSLYLREGFREMGRLLSWRRPASAPAPETSETLRELSLVKAIQLPSALEYPDLPWAISRHAIAKMAKGRAFGSSSALIVTGDLEVAPVRLHALSCPSSDVMEWSALRKATAALFQLYPDREFWTPAVFPERFGQEVFEPLGFAQDPLTQFLMRYDLSDA